MNQPSLTDVLKACEEQKVWTCHFTLCPNTWKRYLSIHEWHNEKLDRTKANNIPDEAGIYTLILQPGIANHPACSYLMYVGQTKSLRKRFRKYLTSEKRITGRPKIFAFLNWYDGFICFYYTLVKMETLDTVEDALMDAYQPPLNTEFKGTLSKARSAFT
jgi:excinuclease UvrABC nuclease subunit